MPVIICPLKSCTYETPDVDASIAAYLLTIHSNVHIYASLSKPKPLMGDRPQKERDCNEEVWNTFLQKWTMSKDSTEIIESEKPHQLYH